MTPLVSSSAHLIGLGSGFVLTLLLMAPKITSPRSAN